MNQIVEYYYYSRYIVVDSMLARILNFWVNNFWPVFKVVATLVGFAAAVGSVRIYKKLVKLNLEEQELYGSRKVSMLDGTVVSQKNEKWDHIIELINSANSSDWRLAIIEADVMLEDLLRRAGYHGESLGEMLKSVERSDFLTIESAWEAHKIRNAVAHQGRDFPLNEREAKHAISLYEEVFKEFKMI